MAPHSSTLAWKIQWTEEPGRLQSMGSLRVWATSLSLSCIGEGNGNPLQCSCLENPRDGGAWWAAVDGVTLSRTRLKRLSSSSSMLDRGQIQNVGHQRSSLLWAPWLIHQFTHVPTLSHCWSTALKGSRGGSMQSLFCGLLTLCIRGCHQSPSGGPRLNVL